MKKLLIIIFLICSTLTFGQNKQICKRINIPPKAKQISEFINGEFSKTLGMFNIYHKENKWYLEIPDSLLGREMMSVTRFSKMPPGAPFYAGELANQQMIMFEGGINNRINLRSVGVIVSCPDSTSAIFTAVENSNYQPIVKSFEIQAFSDETYLIDVTQLFASDMAFMMKPPMKILFGIISIDTENSYISSVRSFPLNIEISTVKNFSIKSDSRIQIARETGYMSMEFNTSLLLLPKSPMKVRKYDRRLGYFSNSSDLFDDNLQNVPKREVIVRHRLEPKTEADAIRQAGGESIEPKNPIVFYIDPATPEKWKPFLKQGVEDWNEAFEAAGWKNAIRGEYWDKSDTTKSLEDARFSVIRYLASSNPNAYSLNVNDPRTGEIIQTQIGWYHNVMQLLHEWYFIQTSASNPEARTTIYSDKLMGQLIRFVSAHEVGHSLGLIHNMRASSSTPVEKLRDPLWIKKYGHTSSIMDYSRFNYVAQPGDGIDDYFPRVSDYDKWAIKWGYSNLDGKSDQEKILDTWVIEAFRNPRLRYTHEGIENIDPRNQTEDLGDNSMKASEYGIKNLMITMSHLREWSTGTQNDFRGMEQGYNAIVAQFKRYLGHVLTNIGGLYCDPNTPQMEGKSFYGVPAHIQKDAVNFLCEYLFDTPIWLVDNSVLCDFYKLSGTEVILDLQGKMISGILDDKRLARIVANQTETGFTVYDLLTSLTESIFCELKSVSTINQYRRNLQKLYVATILQLVKKDNESISLESMNFGSFKYDMPFSDFISVAKSNLRRLVKDLEHKSSSCKDVMTSEHCKELAFKISKVLIGDAS